MGRPARRRLGATTTPVTAIAWSGKANANNLEFTASPSSARPWAGGEQIYLYRNGLNAVGQEGPGSLVVGSAVAGGAGQPAITGSPQWVDLYDTTDADPTQYQYSARTVFADGTQAGAANNVLGSTVPGGMPILDSVNGDGGGGIVLGTPATSSGSGLLLIGAAALAVLYFATHQK